MSSLNQDIINSSSNTQSANKKPPTKRNGSPTNSPNTNDKVGNSTAILPSPVRRRITPTNLTNLTSREIAAIEASVDGKTMSAVEYMGKTRALSNGGGGYGAGDAKAGGKVSNGSSGGGKTASGGAKGSENGKEKNRYDFAMNPEYKNWDKKRREEDGRK